MYRPTYTSNRRRIDTGARSQGFSLFELVVFIISVAIIYAAAARRFSDFPGDAERANFFAITAQVQSAINLEMMMGITRGQTSHMGQYANANPMDLLLEPPSNYIGSYDFVDKASLDRRIWYFDKSRNELVYLANDSDGLSHLIEGSKMPSNEVRFTLTVVYSYRDAITGLPVELNSDEVGDDQGLRRNLSGLLLKPVIPFEWEAGDIEGNLNSLVDS